MGLSSRLVRFVERPLLILHPVGALPDGYLECNGASVSRSVYGWLFSKIGTTYGAGDGSTTFNIPDLRGEFVRGWDNGRGVDSGRALGSAQGDQNKAHTHTATGTITGSNGFSSSGFTGTRSGSVTTSSNGGGEARPRNVAQMFCIAWKP